MAYDVLSGQSPRFVTPAGYGMADSPMSTESAVSGLDCDPFRAGAGQSAADRAAVAANGGRRVTPVQRGGVTSAMHDLAPALVIDARLTEIERSVDLLLNITPVNAAEAWADFERSDFVTAPTLRLRPLEFEPDLVRRDLYGLEIENVADPALHALFRAKRDEIARQITALEDRDTSRFVYGSLQLYGGTSQSLTTIARELLETIPARAPNTESVTAGAFAEAARAEFDRYRAVYPDFPVHIDVREDISELMVSFGRLLIPEAAAVRADRVEPLLHHEVGTHVVTYQNGTRQPLTLLTIGLPGYDETQEGLAVLAEYVVGGLDPRRLRVLAARVLAVDQMLDGAGFLEIFESLRTEYRIPAAHRVVHRHPGRRRGWLRQGRDLPAWHHAPAGVPRRGQQPRCAVRRQVRPGSHPLDPGPSRPRRAPGTVGPPTVA